MTESKNRLGTQLSLDLRSHPAVIIVSNVSADFSVRVARASAVLVKTCFELVRRNDSIVLERAVINASNCGNVIWRSQLSAVGKKSWHWLLRCSENCVIQLRVSFSFPELRLVASVFCADQSYLQPSAVPAWPRAPSCSATPHSKQISSESTS